MTDRLKGLIVTFRPVVRDDDAEGIIAAIKLLPHVLSVKGFVNEWADDMAEQRARADIAEKLFKTIYPVASDGV